MRLIVCRATAGLSWGAGPRGWMAAVAGEQSRYRWPGTAPGVLLSAALVGATLGWPARLALGGPVAAAV